MVRIFSNLKQGMAFAAECLKKYGQLTQTGGWQGIHKPTQMFEVDNVYFRACMPSTLIALEEQVKPDLPWAEDHFQERVGGIPLNPGEQYKNWPRYKDHSFNDKNFRNVGDKFTHTYMERYWPKDAGDGHWTAESPNGNVLLPSAAVWKGFNEKPLKGIRYHYGDLMDVVNLLKKDPTTRQAYLPVWFPEDTGVLHGGRVPCSLGYHFQLKGDSLNIHYGIRACDYIRHFRNDVYLTVRLCQWVLEKLQESGDDWKRVTPGIFTMDILHFHVFAQEKNLI